MSQNLKVLIVDDFNSFRYTLSKIIHDLGFTYVDNVTSGEDALDVCRREHYDLILCDYNLGPGKNGQQTLEELRLEGLLKPQDIFILISAETRRNVVMSAYDGEPDAYLTKPITSKVIQQRLSRLLKKRKDMLDVYTALGDGKESQAIALLESKVVDESRYAMECQKILASLYVKHNQLSKAEKLYTTVLEMRTVNWAQVGLAHVKIKKGEPKKAMEWLNKIIHENPSYMKAYDVLSEALRVLEDNDQLQKNLERAVEVSPMSTARQVLLGSVAMNNGDMEVAAEAYSKAIKYGANSCYYTTENQLNYVKSVARFFNRNKLKAERMAKDALAVALALQNSDESGFNEKLQTQLLESQLCSFTGDLKRSENILNAAHKVLEECENVDIEVEVEIINALLANNKIDKAQRKISDLLGLYAKDQSALEKIDPLLKEPASEKAKKILINCNKKGIDAYQDKEYDTAVHFFTKIERLYPQYLGVKLNLLQALIARMRDNGKNESDDMLCSAIIESVEKDLSPGDLHYDRYKQLQDMLSIVMG